MCDDKIIKELLVFLNPVLEKESDYQEISEALFKDEQVQVAKIFFQIQNNDPLVIWEILRKFIEKFEKGGDQRMKYTLPSAVFRLIQLIVQIYSSEDRPEAKGYKKILEMIRKLIHKLGEFQPVVAIKLYLEYILLINHLDETKFYDEWTYVTLLINLVNCELMFRII